LGIKIDEPERERAQFKELILKNPNYFGTLPGSPLEVVKKMIGNTHYEELTCIGFNPKTDMLEATVQIKRSYGYGTNLCGSGTTEYVRFFVDYDDGDGWEDLGLTSFQVYNIPNASDCADDPNKPLTYVATMAIEPKFRRSCGNPVLPKVRGVLSWQKEPEADKPNWPMVWGNRLDRHIQIKPRALMFFDFVKAIEAKVGAEIEVPEIFEAAISELIPLPPDPPPLKLSKLAEKYISKGVTKGADDSLKASVEPHRFGFSDIHAEMVSGGSGPQAVVLKMAKWAGLELDWAGSLEALEKTKGNVNYEELDCLGLDYNREWIVATFRIKRPTGYLGDLCEPGSYEYVAFWVDWNDQCVWTHLKTVKLKVHDIEDIPSEGLHYMVFLPVDLRAYRQGCEKPKTGRIRAVLSWNTSPSETDPDDIPHWGNRLDTHVLIKPGEVDPEPTAKIAILGGIGVDDINTSTNGLTKPFAKFAESGAFADHWDHSRECPFGGRVNIHGMPPLTGSGYKYRIWIKKVASPEPAFILTTSVYVVNGDGVGSFHFPDSAGFFDYLSDYDNLLDTLGRWFTGNLGGLWKIQLELADASNTVIDTSPWYRIRLDNTKPDAEIDIDGGACDKYSPGVSITGTFVANDPYFGHFIMDTLPLSMVPPPYKPKDDNTNSSEGILPEPSGTWTLDTSGPPEMISCGYVVRIRVWDRAIRDSDSGKHNREHDDKGFCLIEES
jgi:hypothetical protein